MATLTTAGQNRIKLVKNLECKGGIYSKTALLILRIMVDYDEIRVKDEFRMV